MRRRAGFTLIELTIVLALVALLATLAVPRYFASVERARESVLRDNLRAMRDAIDHYYADHGRYPESLDALAARRYLREIPPDPVTGSAATWVVVAPPADAASPAGVFDVRSGAPGEAQDGTPYARL
jgi:general secretion pathway protein G